MIITSRSKRKNFLGYQHSTNQPGWRNSSPKAGYANNSLGDEDYHRTLAFHNPLWRYIIQHYKKESQCPIAFFGRRIIPLAIELSQWTYPITFITSTLAGIKQAQRDCEIQAGTFKELLYFNYQFNCPRNRVIAFLSVLEGLTASEMIDFLEVMLRRSNEIVTAVPYDRDWRGILKGKFNFDMKKYPDKDFYLLTIKDYE